MFGLIKKKIIKFLEVYTANEIPTFVCKQLSSIPAGSKLLDLGAGTQPYRKFSDHLEYFSQDFCQSSEGIGYAKEKMNYKPVDYVGNCWKVDEKSDFFDAILCTEVLEHVPYPVETIKEVSRLLKNEGLFILTIPCFSIRHMDPHWFTPGFSDRWIEYHFKQNHLSIVSLQSVGSHKSILISELFRIAMENKVFFPFLLFTMVFLKIFYKPNQSEVHDYMVVGKKLIVDTALHK